MKIVCSGCSKDDSLYEDNHGTFCSRCGPSVPMRASIFWHYGITFDKEGKMVEYTSDGKGGLEPCKTATTA